MMLTTFLQPKNITPIFTVSLILATAITVFLSPASAVLTMGASALTIALSSILVNRFFPTYSAQQATDILQVLFDLMVAGCLASNRGWKGSVTTEDILGYGGILAGVKSAFHMMMSRFRNLSSGDKGGDREAETVEADGGLLPVSTDPTTRAAMLHGAIQTHATSTVSNKPRTE